jgi:hypothetical protein
MRIQEAKTSSKNSFCLEIRNLLQNLPVNDELKDRQSVIQSSVIAMFDCVLQSVPVTFTREGENSMSEILEFGFNVRARLLSLSNVNESCLSNES